MEEPRTNKEYCSCNCKLRLLVALLVSIGTLTVASAQDQCVLGAQNQCVLDDNILLVQALQSVRIVSEVAGPCPDVAGYQGTAFGIVTSFSVLNNNLAGSYCIGFIVDTDSTNAVPLAYFQEFPTFAVVGSINITANSIIYSIRGATATFSVGDTSGYHHYQLCASGSDLRLYENCSAVGQLPFSHAGFSDNDELLLLKETDINNEKNIYMGAVSQFYILSCSGPDITQDWMAQLQCVARNPTCTGNPSISITAAVTQYLAQLNIPPPVDTEPLCLLNRLDRIPCPYDCPTLLRAGANQYSVHHTSLRESSNGTVECEVRSSGQTVKNISTLEFGTDNVDFFAVTTPDITKSQLNNDQVLVEYNVQCKDDQLASYMITDLDIQGRNCDVGNGTYVCQDYILIDDGTQVTEICGNTFSSSFVATESSHLSVIFRNSQTVERAEFRILVVCFHPAAEQDISDTKNENEDPPADNVDDNVDDDSSAIDSLSTGGVAGIAVTATLLLVLPVGVVAGLGVVRCLRKHGKGVTSEAPEESLEAAIPLSDNQAYGQEMVGEIYEDIDETAMTLCENQVYGQEMEGEIYEDMEVTAVPLSENQAYGKSDA